MQLLAADVAEGSIFDTIIEVAMVAMLVFMPAVFGAVEPWSELVVISLASIMALCLLLKLVFVKDARFVWSWAYVPLGLFLLVGLLQAVSWQVSVVKAISPDTVAMKTRLLSDIANAGKTLQQMTISFYPYATWHGLRLALAGVVVFVVVINVYRSSERILRLLTAIMFIGGAFALLALGQDVAGNGEIYWCLPTYGKAFSGTFVNHSHYGQFMNLSIGASLGVLMVKLYEKFPRREVDLPEIMARLGEHDFRIVWYCVGIIVIGIATIFISLTRGGMVALLIALGFTAVVLSFKRGLQGRSWVIAVMALGAFICVLYIGFDSVYDRLATLEDFQQNQGGRWQIVKDIATAWTRFPVLGTGLGTHDVVYPMFDRATTAALASHAENEYAQMAEETGAVGLGLVIIFLVMVWRIYAKNIRNIRLPIQAAAVGLGFGLLAVMIHSLSDFGQHLPANAMLSLISCALLIAMLKVADRVAAPVGAVAAEPVTDANITGDNMRTGNAGGSRHLAWVVPVGLVIVLACGMSVWGGIAAARGKSQWNKVLKLEAKLSRQNWLGSNAEFADILYRASQATRYQPGNAMYRHWLNVYRWRAISRVTDPQTGKIVLTPASLKYTRQIIDDLSKVRLLCPTYGPTYCVAGELEYFILGDSAGARLIETGYKLAPNDPTCCYVAGLLAVHQGNMADSVVKFQRAVKLNGTFFNDIMNVYLHQVNRPDLVVKMAQNDLWRLNRIASLLSKEPGEQALTRQARQRVAELLKQRCNSPDVTAGALAALANLYLRDNDTADAEKYFRKALTIDYGNTGWRMALARLLEKKGDIKAAMHEARICLRLKPQMQSAKKLIEKLSVE